jgi:phosphoribosylformylglycinamidine synthase subunit PurL
MPDTPSPITPQIVAEHGFTAQEYARVLHAMGREPNLTELGIFSVMWSEHCSYKSSRIHLKKLPTEAPWVICGPGENAGVIDIGDGQAAIFKMESHNHPSYIEPYQGAASGVGNSIVYVGSKTGRDGIHGATMASADFSDDTEEKRPTVQVGDPFTEKLLIEACLELMATDAIVAIQDMGAAGLTSSSVEMASKGGCGIRLNMNAVPQRETGMTPYEMMLSESQERMLMVLKPGREAMAEAIFHKWELDFAIIGEVTDTGHMVLDWNGEVVADIPLGPLADDAPQYDRPYISKEEYKVWANVKPLGQIPESTDIAADLLKLMASPDIASRRWIYEQYDQKVGGDTVQAPGGDAAVVRVHGTEKALAMTTDCTPRYCYADPYEGGKQAIAEAYRNLSAVGATPLAVTNCLNFGNPQRPEIMAQFVGCLEGMADACRALDFPIVSGNVSLYNESKATGGGSAILPTPAIGAVGLLKDWRKAVGIGFKGEGEEIWLIGASSGHLGQSMWLREIGGRQDGPAPDVDLGRERHASDAVRSLIEFGYVSAVHDVSDGGLLVALAEMALAGDLGANLTCHRLDSTQATEGQPMSLSSWWFGEEQGRYVVTTSDTYALHKACSFSNLARVKIGTTGGSSIMDQDFEEIPLAALRAAHEGFFPALMGKAG